MVKAKDGRDATREYGAPEGHTIKEYRDHDKDPTYRGHTDVKHLVLWRFEYESSKYTVHLTNKGVPIAHLLGPTIGLTLEEARKRASRVKTIMEANGQGRNLITLHYQATRGQPMLAVKMEGVDYLLNEFIGKDVPTRLRERFSRLYGAFVHSSLLRLKELAGKLPPKRPRDQDYSILLEPNARPPASQSAKGHPPTGAVPSVAHSAGHASCSPLDKKTAPSEGPPAASEDPPPAEPVAEKEQTPEKAALHASKSTPPEQRRKRLRKLAEAAGEEAPGVLDRSEGATEVIAPEDKGAQQEEKAPEGNGLWDSAAEEEALAPPVKMQRSAADCQSGVGDATGSGAPFSPAPSFQSPPLGALPVNTLAVNALNTLPENMLPAKISGASEDKGSQAAEHLNVAPSRGKENMQPSPKPSIPFEVPSSHTQTVPSAPRNTGPQHSLVGGGGEKLEEPIVVEMGGLQRTSVEENERTAPAPLHMSVHSSFQAACGQAKSSTPAPAFSTARDGRALPLFPQGQGMHPANAIKRESSVTSAGGFSRVTQGQATGGTSGVKQKGQTGIPAPGRKRKVEEEHVEGGETKKARRAAKNECGCGKIADEEVQAYREDQSSARGLHHRLVQEIVNSQPEHERLQFVQNLCNMTGYGCSNLVQAAPPVQTPLELIQGPLQDVVASLDYVADHLSAVVKEAPSTRMVDAMRRDPHTRKLEGWQANMSTSGLHHFQENPDRPHMPKAKNTAYGLYCDLRNNAHHKKRCNQLVPLGSHSSIGHPCFLLRQYGLDFPKSLASLYWLLAKDDVNVNYNMVAAAPRGLANSEMRRHVLLLEEACDKGQMWALLQALRSLRLGSVMECRKWR